MNESSDAPREAPPKNQARRTGQAPRTKNQGQTGFCRIKAKVAQIEGVVIAEVIIDETGRVTDARILRSIPLLDEAALQAVREWRFAPSIVDGRAVPVKMTVTVNFQQRRP